MGNAMKSKWQRSGMGWAALAASPPVLADYGYNLQVPASSGAHDVFQLHNLIMLVCLVISSRCSASCSIRC